MKQLLCVFLLWGTPVCAQDFNTRLVLKLSEILGVEAPKKIVIEVVSQKELLGDYRNYLVANCIGNDHSRAFFCMQNVVVEGNFVHGLWIPEKDGSLHVKLHMNSGMDALIHEYTHWFLNQLAPFLNNHTVLETVVARLLTSPELLEWLEKEQK